MENIRAIAPRRLVLISTVDADGSPAGVDENDAADLRNPQAYGRNRALLEEWVRAEYPGALIVRLPGLYGKGLKKNFLFDLHTVTPFMLKEEKYRELAEKSPLVRAGYAPAANGFYRLNGAVDACALPFFEAIAAYAREHGAAIALEANPPVYGTNFCNTSREAFAFARRVPGLAVNYDIGTLLTNGEDMAELFDNLDLVTHIHISEPGLAPIMPREMHRELAARLRRAGYAGFVSVEMKTQPFETAKRALEYAAEVFA